MSHLVFKLNNVPDDESNEIRRLLDDLEIEYYETDTGRWGLGFAAIWLPKEDHLEKAKDAIEQYQKERCERVRSEHKALDDSGENITRFQYFMTSPIKFSILLIFAGALAYFTVLPFFKAL